jgi:hypothetical protein
MLGQKRKKKEEDKNTKCVFKPRMGISVFRTPFPSTKKEDRGTACYSPKSVYNSFITIAVVATAPI